jgi:PAS domain-containing protein
MFRWLFLNESALAPAEHAAWKISTLRILLVSGFILEAWVALHSSFRAVERGAYEILLTVISLYALKSVAIWGSRKYPRFSAALLLLNIYGIASAISIFTRDPELASWAICLYISRRFWRGYFHSRLALILMLLNTIPYVSVISGYSHSLEGHHPIPDAEIYIHTLFYFFFNICLPLAVFRILYALDATLVQYQDTSGALQVSHAQYQEVFENAGTALLLTDAYGQILQANQQANHLLGRNPQTDSELALFGWLSLDEF